MKKYLNSTDRVFLMMFSCRRGCVFVLNLILNVYEDRFVWIILWNTFEFNMAAGHLFLYLYHHHYCFYFPN